MSRVPRLFLALAAALLGVAVLPSVQVAAGGVCFNQMPASVSLARGWTFSATVLAFEPATDANDGLATTTFAVDHVFAGANKVAFTAIGRITFKAGQTITLDGGCAAIEGLHVGARYLVSTGNPVASGAYETAIWSLAGDRAALVRMYRGRPFDHRLLQPSTLDDVLALMAPSALPPTDTAAVADGRQPLGVVLLALPLALACSLWFRLRLRSLAGRRNQRHAQ